MDLVVAAMTAAPTVMLAQKAEAEFCLVILRPQKYSTTAHPACTLLDVIAKPPATQGLETEEDQTQSSEVFWPNHLSLRYDLDRMSKWYPHRISQTMFLKCWGSLA
jgi:hypothetical protein